jgi:predicted GNAT family N-acyltransferase
MPLKAVTVRQSATLTNEEQAQLFDWDADVFATEGYGYQWQDKEWHILVEVDHYPVSHVGLLRREASVGEVVVVLGALGGVVTPKPFQGQGFGTRALTEAVAVLRQKWRVDFGALLCREPLVPFYVRLGWQRVDAPVFFAQPHGPVLSPLVLMVLPCSQQVWPHGAVNLHGLPF